MFYTVKEIAKKLSVTTETILYLCRRGIIPHRRIGHRFLFDASSYKWIIKNYKPAKKSCGRKKNKINKLIQKKENNAFI